MRKIIILAITMMVLCAMSAYALPSLNPNDWEDVTTEIRGTKQTFTVIQDAQNPAMWYYVPKSPQLVENNGKPVFQLLKYQVSDETNKEMDVSGGVLQFAINLALPVEAQAAIRQRVFQIKSVEWQKATASTTDDLEAKRQLKATDIRLSCLPLASASVVVYDLGGNMAAQGGQMGGVAPTFANQDMVFQIKLNKLGADVYDALVNKNTGIPCYITYSFKGISPKNGFKVEVDWEQTFKHYSSDEKTKKTVGCWLWSKTSETRVSDLRENLNSNKCIKVTSLSGDAMSDEEQDKYLEPIMKRINDEMLENMKLPEKIDPAQAPDARGGGWFGGGGSSLAIKSVAKDKRGKETIIFDKQKVILSNSGCGAFIGLGKYDKKIREECVTLMPPGNWANALFTLPQVGDDARLGIKQLDLTVSMVDKDGKPLVLETESKTQASTIPQQSVTWTPDKGFWFAGNEKDKPRGSLLFPMAYIYSKLSKVEIAKLQYKISMKVTQLIKSATFIYKFDSFQTVIDGDVPLSTPLDCIEPVTVNAGLLTFNKEDKSSDLLQLSASVSFEDSTKTKKTISSSLMDQSKGSEIVFLVAKDKPFTFKLQYNISKKGQVAWKDNGYVGDLRDRYPGLEILPEQDEWRPDAVSTIDTTGE